MESQEAKTALTVAIVDDDLAMRDLLSEILHRAGFLARTFAGGDEFLAEAASLTVDCLLLDLYMPSGSGLDVLRVLTSAKYPAPVIMISARGSIAAAVEAMKAGATDFIEKPFETHVLIDRINEAVASFHEAGGAHKLPPRSNRHKGALSGREMEVLERIIHGATNKRMAQDLGLSPRTVETYRAQILKKLGARNTADLLRIVLGDEA